jgi:excisionase family DNA binding protein
LEVELCEVFERHRRRLRVDGVTPSTDLAAVERAVLSLVGLLARGRQGTTKVDAAADAVHAQGMGLLVDFEDCARELHVSRRTVERMARNGELPTVSVGGRPRVRCADLNSYVAGLEPRSSRRVIAVPDPPVEPIERNTDE